MINASLDSAYSYKSYMCVCIHTCISMSFLTLFHRKLTFLSLVLDKECFIMKLRQGTYGGANNLTVFL